MTLEEQESRSRTRLQSFHELMQRRVKRILLVSSLYDSFIMSEEGHLQETLLSQFIDLNLTNTPDLLQVPSVDEALELADEGTGFDLIIGSLYIGDSDLIQLIGRLREAGSEVPVIGLAYTARELKEFLAVKDTSQVERIFLWQGDVRLLLAMVKYLEDRLNVENDTGCCGVPAIIVVEDNVRFYSSFMPTVYSELYRHTERVLAEGLNISQKMMRMRARPKVLLGTSFEEAWDYFERYEDQVLGVISDFQFPKAGKLENHAGQELCARIHAARPDIRIVMQSSNPDNQVLAEELEASFLLKGSPMLLTQLRSVLVERFGFGDFIFRGPDGHEVDRADSLRSLGKKLKTAPAESIVYHAERNHFSNWLKARTEFALAERLRPRNVGEFESIEHMRDHLLRMVNDYRLERHRTVIADFDRKRFEPSYSITRIGGGSLGGKARGVAFANRILRSAGIDEAFPAVDIYVPPSVVLSTQVFDEFMEYWGLRDYAIGKNPDREIVQHFLEAPFPRSAIGNLRAFLQKVKYPLAVRSSSLLEDSLSQPFAGVYQTFMLPNNDPDLDVRWLQLSSAIKRVYASAFMEQAKEYLSMTTYRLEEEKMAVMIQQLVGNAHEDRFYPDFAGVARSYNFYPEPGHAPEDGVVAVALGMGRAVVGGEPCLRFCPKYPKQIVTFSSVNDALENSQREFYGLSLMRKRRDASVLELDRLPLSVAEEDGLLTWLGSTYLPEDNRIVDGISRAGTRLVSFAQILKHEAFPLAELLRELLHHCSESAGAPVEIEFAGNLGHGKRRPQFAFLQMRPLSMSNEPEEVEIGEVNAESVLCHSNQVLGNGRMDDITDLVVVDAESFERRKSVEVAQQVAHFDSILRKEERPYILIGVGRWGSADPHLGIPVTWNQIAGARVIVEAGFKDFKVAPSQGTHFFQNLTSGHVGYFTVNPDAGEGLVDWEWLKKLPSLGETEFVRHVHLDQPVEVKIDGHNSEGVILKPATSGSSG